jgi:hypothetical protein
MLSILAKTVNYKVTRREWLAARRKIEKNVLERGGMQEIWRGRFTFLLFEAST